MNKEWQEFLASQSIEVDDSGQVCPPAAAQPYPDCALNDLSHLGLIRISGEDAEHLLQGQFTSDLREIGTGRWQMSAYCNPKGRMLASFLIFKRGGDFLLQLPMGVHALLLKRLPMFVFMADAQVTDASDELVRIGLAGDCAPALLQPHFQALPQRPGSSLAAGDVSLLRLFGETPRFELVGSPEAMIPLWRALAKQSELANQDYWPLQDIRAGIPVIYPRTSEAFVPQMTNLQLIDGVSFTKGCYTGQEVVARMKYLGKLKRRMYLAHVATDQRPQPGDELFSERSESGQGPGRVVDARPAPDGGFDLLAVMEIERRDKDDLHLLRSDGPKLQFRELPYSFEEA